MDTLSQTWREEAATLRRRGATVQAEVLESCAADLETQASGPQLSTGRATGKALSADVVAEQLGVSRYRVYKLIRTGKLSGIRMGRQVRVASDVLARFVSLGGAP